jgi:Domain of unknown function (DUF4262)
MCRICEGFSLEDVLALDAARIDEYGFVLVGVADPEDDHDPWVYTVGLLDAADHPELIIAGVATETSAAMLGSLARAALAGERFEVGDTIDLGQGGARVGAVHPVQYDLDTFNMWHELQDFGALEAAQLEAVQIVLSSAFFCRNHRGSQPLLNDRGARVGSRPAPPNRAERRRRPPRGRPSM